MRRRCSVFAQSSNVTEDSVKAALGSFTDLVDDIPCAFFANVAWELAKPILTISGRDDPNTQIFACTYAFDDNPAVFGGRFLNVTGTESDFLQSIRLNHSWEVACPRTCDGGLADVETAEHAGVGDDVEFVVLKCHGAGRAARGRGFPSETSIGMKTEDGFTRGTKDSFSVAGCSTRGGGDG